MPDQIIGETVFALPLAEWNEVEDALLEARRVIRSINTLADAMGWHTVLPAPLLEKVRHALALMERASRIPAETGGDDADGGKGPDGL